MPVGRHTGVTRLDKTTGDVSSTRAISLLNVFGLNWRNCGYFCYNDMKGETSQNSI